jgi:cytochrome P450
MSDQTSTELRAEIARTRAALGDTVETLAGRLDVRARARDAVDDVKARAAEIPLAVIAAVIVGLGVVIYLFGRRRP